MEKCYPKLTTCRQSVSKTKKYQSSPTVSWSGQRLQLLHFSQICTPLTNLLKKNSLCTWNHECDDVFDQIRAAMAQRQILNIHDPSKGCILYCNASQAGFGAVLKRVGGDRMMHPIAYYSRKLFKHEESYAIAELECLATASSADK